MRTSHHGSCLCGGIDFTVTGPVQPIQVCHCRQCQKAQGGPVAAVVPVEAESIAFHRGEELLQAHESSPGKTRVFCRRCGSPVFSRRDSVPGILRIRAGLFDPPLDTRIAHHAFTASNAEWWPICDGAPQYPGQVS